MSFRPRHDGYDHLRRLAYVEDGLFGLTPGQQFLARMLRELDERERADEPCPLCALRDCVCQRQNGEDLEQRRDERLTRAERRGEEAKR